jgi:ribosomal protein S18 acetylase RimI-like enzyme
VNVRPFRPEDAATLAALSAHCARSSSDFVLNPLWEDEQELLADFAHHGIDPREHLLVADGADDEVIGAVGFLRRPGSALAGLVCPIVARDERGRGIGGRLLRAGLEHGAGALGIRLVSAGIGTRNRAGYALLLATGFRPGRQYFLMRCSERPKAPAVGKLRFEPARPTDADAILGIYAACGFEKRSAEAMRAVLADGRHAHAVAREGGKLVAFAEIETHWPRRPWVAFVGVEPSWRDRGLGSSIVSWALARQFEAGADGAQLLLSPANRTAVRAYEKVGFQRHRLVDVLDKAL